VKYQEYLQSDEWKIKRQLALQQAGGRCRICNDSEKLHVHHRSYKRKGTPEEVLDLVVLCAECHDWFHKRKKIEDQLIQSSENNLEVELIHAERDILVFALSLLGSKEAAMLTGKAGMFLEDLGMHKTGINWLSIAPDIYWLTDFIKPSDSTYWMARFKEIVAIVNKQVENAVESATANG
jgi:hypothetical protein